MDSIRDVRDVLLLINTFCATVALIIAVAVWLRRPGADAARQLGVFGEGQAAIHQDHKNRLTTLEERIRHMPTKEELTELEGTVKQIDERTEGLAEAIGTIRTTLNRIESFLLSHKS